MTYSILKRLKKVQPSDFFHIVLFLIAFPIALFYKRKRKGHWLICEYSNEARDNAFYLFKYLCKNVPSQDCVYAIKKTSKDYYKVVNLGKTVQYGSLKHWILYLSAECNISSQKGGKPNAALCYILEVKLRIIRNTRVFLQHGITKDNIPSFHYKDTYFSLFMCAANPEYKYIKETYGYPKRNIQKVGFCRYDSLVPIKIEKLTILIMPTWRDYLFSLNNKNFLKTDYYKYWQNLLLSTELQNIQKKNNVEILFYPHRNMNKFLKNFCKSNYEIVKWMETDTQVLLRRTSILITDYSSTAMDFAYMKKPLLYFQFDYDIYRKEHLHEGYFDYERDGFGKVCKTKTEVCNELEKLIHTTTMQARYEERQKNFFSFNDSNNCKRNYEAINNLITGENNE